MYYFLVGLVCLVVAVAVTAAAGAVENNFLITHYTHLGRMNGICIEKFEHVEHFENCIECRSLVYAIIAGFSVHFVLPKKRRKNEQVNNSADFQIIIYNRI